MTNEARDKLLELAGEGAQIYVSHSGGKDSQALYAWVMERLPRDQVTVVHADLGEIEWSGVQDHIRANIGHELNVVQAVDRDGNIKTFFDMVRHRARTRPDVPAWPSSATRQCTSDLKRGPIEKFIRAHMTENGHRVGVNATGIRAEESAARAKRAAAGINKRLSKAGREVWDIAPLHDWLEAEVFEQIRQVGQKPFWAYAAGNKRLSCVFCIMGCGGDLANGRKHRPELFEKYCELERETGWTMFAGKSLAERAGG